MKKTTQETMILKNGREVSVALYKSVHAEVKARLALKEVGQEFTLKELCSADYWVPMKGGPRRRAGWCIKHIADSRLLPVRFVMVKSNKSKLYRKT